MSGQGQYQHRPTGACKAWVPIFGKASSKATITSGKQKKPTKRASLSSRQTQKSSNWAASIFLHDLHWPEKISV